VPHFSRFLREVGILLRAEFKKSVLDFQENVHQLPERDAPKGKSKAPLLTPRTRQKWGTRHPDLIREQPGRATCPSSYGASTVNVAETVALPVYPE
jgi:hypothetical protein